MCTRYQLIYCWGIKSDRCEFCFELSCLITQRENTKIPQDERSTKWIREVLSASAQNQTRFGYVIQIGFSDIKSIDELHLFLFLTWHNQLDWSPVLLHRNKWIHRDTSGQSDRRSRFVKSCVREYKYQLAVSQKEYRGNPEGDHISIQRGSHFVRSQSTCSIAASQLCFTSISYFRLTGSNQSGSPQSPTPH